MSKSVALCTSTFSKITNIKGNFCSSGMLRSVDCNRHFGTTYRFHLQGSSSSVETLKMKVFPKRQLLTTNLRCVTSRSANISFTPRCKPDLTLTNITLVYLIREKSVDFI